MYLQAIETSIILSIAILMPLSIKWQIKLKHSLTGTLIIGLIAGIVTNIITISFHIASIYTKLLLEFLLIISLATASVAYMFYRDPEREVPEQDGIIVAPADGKVIYIKEIREGMVPLSIKKGHQIKLEEITQTDFLKDGGFMIGIAMNFLNVHVNRAPVSGMVELIKHVKGSFLSLKQDEAILENERLTTIFNEGRFKVAVVQIASRLVRRIETYLTEGQIVKKGQRIGMIKFGSQVDLIIQNHGNNRITVQPGDEVKAGVSVLVEYE